MHRILDEFRHSLGNKPLVRDPVPHTHVKQGRAVCARAVEVEVEVEIEVVGDNEQGRNTPCAAVLFRQVDEAPSRGCGPPRRVSCALCQMKR
jgi:hypothetical protein